MSHAAQICAAGCSNSLKSHQFARSWAAGILIAALMRTWTTRCFRAQHQFFTRFLWMAGSSHFGQLFESWQECDSRLVLGSSATNPLGHVRLV
ncbi:unnamed protein product [Fusarium graminearum]|nr:unnamed protein product [Fusarium graminearum]CAF3550911.1 unnamed protein product [Fusarium graminearum]CAF3569722.1 unnamed protein product [Fusarium graminearum]CZS84827.1 unnamed protein product [Fusarium graminearum]VTO93405.1 unnamed protein product [Fusarium graminearum]